MRRCRGPINPILMMNRAGHRLFQKVAPGKCMHAAGGGKDRCFYIVSAVIGDPFPTYINVCFNAEHNDATCTLAGDWSFTADLFGGYDTVQFEQADINCILWLVAKAGEAQWDASPQDQVRLNYAQGTCHREGETGNEDCLLDNYSNFVVTNRIYGPLSTRIGDLADNIVLVTFPSDNPLVNAGSGFKWRVYYDDVEQTGLTYNIVGGNLQITVPTPATNGTVVTVTHGSSSPLDVAQGQDGRYVWRFEKMPVLNVIGVSFWNREDAGPWLLNPRGTGRWRLEN